MLSHTATYTYSTVIITFTFLLRRRADTLHTVQTGSKERFALVKSHGGYCIYTKHFIVIDIFSLLFFFLIFNRDFAEGVQLSNETSHHIKRMQCTLETAHFMAFLHNEAIY